MNQVVARFLDGNTLKGQTNDFFPNKNQFHIAPSGPAMESRAQQVNVLDLKAVYFVRSLTGRPEYNESSEFATSGKVPGRKIRVVFKDGEVVLGTTQGYQPDRMGFFLIPADPNSNNERCFIVMSATQSVAYV